MAKTTWATGMPLTPEWLNAIQDLRFDDNTAYDGHYPRLADDALSNDPSAIKSQWYTYQQALQVTAGSGLIANYTAGIVTLLDGSLATIAAGTISLPANSTVYIYVDRAGTVQQSTIYPPAAYVLAKVTTGATTISSVVDYRSKIAQRVLPVGQSLRVFGGQGSQGNWNPAPGTYTISGDYYYGNVTIGSGVTINVAGYSKIYATGNVQIDGVINVSAPVSGGNRIYGSVGAQTYPSRIGSGLGGGQGINESGAAAYSYAASLFGSGGSSGWNSFGASSSGTIGTCSGGNGGGAFLVEAAGSITVTGSISANGTAGKGTADIVNTANIGSNSYVTGGGGGSGGLVGLSSLSSVTVTASGVISVQGGAGGTGYTNQAGQTVQQAGGGGGGYAVFVAPSINLTGATINLAGGASSTGGTIGSVSGGSFGGVGGAPQSAGSVGQLITRTVIPG